MPEKEASTASRPAPPPRRFPFRFPFRGPAPGRIPKTGATADLDDLTAALPPTPRLSLDGFGFDGADVRVFPLMAGFAASDCQFGPILAHSSWLRRLDPRLKPRLDPGLPGHADSGWTPLADRPWWAAAADHRGSAVCPGGCWRRNLLLCSPSACWWAALCPAARTRAVPAAPISRSAAGAETLAPSAAGQPATQRLGRTRELLRWGPVHSAPPALGALGGQPPLQPNWGPSTAPPCCSRLIHSANLLLLAPPSEESGLALTWAISPCACWACR